MALRGDGPEDIFDDQIAALADARDAARARSSSAATKLPPTARSRSRSTRRGVKVRVRVIFDVLDALYCD